MASQKNVNIEIKDILRVLEYAKGMEGLYIHWIRRFILFHEKRHPQDMSVAEGSAFLTPLPSTMELLSRPQIRL